MEPNTDVCFPARGHRGAARTGLRRCAPRGDTTAPESCRSVGKHPVKRSAPKKVADYPDTNSQSHTLTFISWLISLFTGCAGFLLRLFSGGLPFSISGIVLARSVSLFGGRKVRSESLDG